MSIPNESNKSGFALDKKNYKLILIGLAIIIFGFLLMIGGRSHDPKVFNESMFNTRRIIIAPLIVFAGFIFEIYAIMKKSVE
jgi:hypothetical protein